MMLVFVADDIMRLSSPLVLSAALITSKPFDALISNGGRAQADSSISFLWPDDDIYFQWPYDKVLGRETKR